jgi:hypothetical protein
LPSLVRVQLYYLYMIIDVFSRKIDTAEVFKQESMANSKIVISGPCCVAVSTGPKHRHSAIRFVTPVERLDDQAAAVLARRDAIYNAARRRHPGRLSGATRS